MRGKLISKFNNLKIGHKILFAFILASIIPILTVQIVGYGINYNLLKKKIDTLMVNNLMQLSERANLNVNIYKNLVYQLYVDDKIVENVRELLLEDSSQKEVAYNEIYNRLSQTKNSMDGIRSISIICRNGMQVTYDADSASTIKNLWSEYEDIREIPPYQKVQGQAGLLVTSTMRFEEDGENKFYFHISKCMYDYNNMRDGTIATIVMSVNESVLKDICFVDMDEAAAEYNVNFITDKNRQVISYPNSFYTGIKMNPKLSVEEFVKVTGLLKGQSTAVNRYVDEDTGWVYYNVYDKDYMLKDIQVIQQVFLILSMAAILFSSLLIFYIVRQMNQSVNSIIGGIKEVQKGNLNVEVPLTSQDELGQIASNLNDMTREVSNLIVQVKEATDKQKDAEIRALEAQINPHFLYNTLDSINWMAIEKEEYDISRMIRNLGVILRYSISKSNKMVAVEEEVEWLNKYIALQQMRFSQSFQYEVNVAGDARRVRVFKLLLQPFIENAIIHGFKGIEAGGLLRIDLMLSKDKDKLCVIIEDNGQGMELDMTNRFNDRKEAIKDEGTSIGLQNAFARMDMYYGESASWNVSSIQGMGTVITLNIPIKEGS